MPAGSVTLTEKRIGVVKEVRWDWTCDASGDVNGFSTTGVYTGRVIEVITDPDDTNAPTASYDVEVLDDDGHDVLAGQEFNRSATATEYVASGLGAVVESKLWLQVTNAGNATQGQVRVFIEGETASL